MSGKDSFAFAVKEIQQQVLAYLQGDLVAHKRLENELGFELAADVVLDNIPEKGPDQVAERRLEVAQLVDAVDNKPVDPVEEPERGEQLVEAAGNRLAGLVEEVERGGLLAEAVDNGLVDQLDESEEELGSLLLAH
jgi:hypothetical protein